MAGAMHCDLPPAYVYESNIHIGNVLITLNEQRKCGLLCDISIMVQDAEFKAHKAILASCSSYFNRIITDPANVSHNIVLELSSISKIGMESLLEFAYTSKLTVTQANIDDVICAARELEFKNIEFSCLNYLKQQLTNGKSADCFLGTTETSNYCENSKISRQYEQYGKQETNADKKSSGKSEKAPQSKYECPLRSKFSFGSKKKAAIAATNASSSANSSQECKEFKYDGNRKSEICGEQMSQEQHQALLKNILERHGLEAATVHEKAMEVGANETAAQSLPMQQGYRQKSMCPGQEKKLCMSGYISPFYNSDTDDLDDEAESSPCNMRPCGKLRKQPAIKLPFTMDEITSMPRSELHDLLTRESNLTQEQICAIHEIRRRGKNRIAAQRCRKRKMECIRSLVAEIETLRSEHAQLMNERREAREQAIKLSGKFRAKCEKFFKCDKKACVKKKFCASATVPDDQMPLHQDGIAAHNFQEHAKKAEDLCARLKEAPTDDLPPCPILATPESNVWSKPCMSPTGTEDIVCTIVDDSSESGYQANSPASSYVMSPSQGLGSDFGNIHISPPGTGVLTSNNVLLPNTTSHARSSVVLHTSSVEGQASVAQTLPSLSTICSNLRTLPTQSPLPPIVRHPVVDGRVFNVVVSPNDAQMTDLSNTEQ
ncbi:transcription regulator protein BACH1-like [Styela clava]